MNEFISIQHIHSLMIMEILFSVLLLFVGVTVLVVIHICIVGGAFRREYEDGISCSNSKKMTAEEVKKLPSFEYKAAAAAAASERPVGVDCVVCLENFIEGDKCRLLPNCSHCFHAQCIDSWLLKTPFCPICRTAAHPAKVGMVVSSTTSNVVDDHQLV